MTKLGAGVDELEIDLLQRSLLCVSQQTLPESQHPLPGSDAAALDHDEVLLDLSVVREASHRVDGLVRNVIFSSSVILHKLRERQDQSWEQTNKR